jgi:hypothetical protein
MSIPTDPDCYWVEPGVLLAGEYPGDPSESVARRKLGALIDCGVRTFVDLTEERELHGYDEWLLDEAAQRGVDVAYHRHAVRDMDVPTPEGMRAILDRIGHASRDHAVYVHCLGGIGRTGTVVCCWLVEKGRTGDEALDDIVELRVGSYKRRRASPEMPGQADFVRQWTPGAGSGD